MPSVVISDSALFCEDGSRCDVSVLGVLRGEYEGPNGPSEHDKISL